ncbi:hypothetical protein [Roseateles asaccharophilus]|uniref:hypothetical protein n=1 Tax=Roseateles asaccharophilus TaxID=582607 RepID=UPI00384B7E1D
MPASSVTQLDYPREVMSMLDAGLDLFISTESDREIGAAPAFIKVRLNTAAVSEFNRLMNTCTLQGFEDLSVLKDPASWDRRAGVEDCTWKLCVDRTAFWFEAKSTVALGGCASLHIPLTYLAKVLKAHADGLPISRPQVAFYGGACFFNDKAVTKLIELVVPQHPEVKAREVEKRMSAAITASTSSPTEAPAKRPRPRAEI